MNQVTTRLLTGPFSTLLLMYLLHNAQTLLETSYRSLFKVPGNEKPGTPAWQRWDRGEVMLQRGVGSFPSFELLGVDEGDLISLRLGPSSLLIPSSGSDLEGRIKWLFKCTFGLTFMSASHFINFRGKVDIHFFIQLIQQKCTAQLGCLPCWMPAGMEMKGQTLSPRSTPSPGGPSDWMGASKRFVIH